MKKLRASVVVHGENGQRTVYQAGAVVTDPKHLAQITNPDAWEAEQGEPTVVAGHGLFGGEQLAQDQAEQFAAASGITAQAAPTGLDRDALLVTAVQLGLTPRSGLTDLQLVEMIEREQARQASTGEGVSGGGLTDGTGITPPLVVGGGPTGDGSGEDTGGDSGGYDPAQHTVDEVAGYAEANPGEVARLIEAERAGKNRSTLIEKLESLQQGGGQE